MTKKEKKHPEYTLSGLYYRYKKVDDDKIREYLNKIKIVKKEDKGVNTIFGYYPISEEHLNKMKEKPRNVSLTFDATETGDIPLTNLVVWKTIIFLVKSSSRFFLKPDIGEVFDQIKWHDLLGDDIKGICVNLDAYETLPDTDGEHFLMEAEILVDKDNLEHAKKMDTLI